MYLNGIQVCECYVVYKVVEADLVTLLWSKVTQGHSQ